jgi:voltage-gated potassium channel
MVAGIALLGVVTASLASWLVDRVREENGHDRAATAAQVEGLMAEVRALRQQLHNATAATDNATAINPPARDE